MGCESSTQGSIQTHQQPIRNQQFSNLNSGHVQRASGNHTLVPTPAVYLTGRERLGSRQPVLVISATSLHTASQKQNQLRQRQSQEQVLRVVKENKAKEADMSETEQQGSNEVRTNRLHGDHFFLIYPQVLLAYEIMLIRTHLDQIVFEILFFCNAVSYCINSEKFISGMSAKL